MFTRNIIDPTNTKKSDIMRKNINIPITNKQKDANLVFDNNIEEKRITTNKNQTRIQNVNNIEISPPLMTRKKVGDMEIIVTNLGGISFCRIIKPIVFPIIDAPNDDTELIDDYY